MIRITNFQGQLAVIGGIAIALGLSVPLVPTASTGTWQAKNSRGGSPGRGGWEGGGGNATAAPLGGMTPSLNAPGMRAIDSSIQEISPRRQPMPASQDRTGRL